MTKHCGFFFLFLILQYNLYSQTNNAFFSNVDLYPKQVNDLIGINITVEESLRLNDFTLGWKGKLFSDSEKEDILKISNVLFDRKARDSHFKLLTFTILSLKEAEKNVENFTITTQYIKDILNNKKITLNAINNFLLNISNILNDNYIHNSSSVKWKYSNSNYIFHLQNNVFSVFYSDGFLTCYSKNDSIIINETSGIYFPVEQKWVSNSGLVTWDKAKFNPSEVNAKLNHYQIDLNKIEYTADSVRFTYPKYFSQPVLGKLVDKVMNVDNEGSALYPEFNSYNKRFLFKDLYENVDYDGGFSMKGSKIIGSGNQKEDAIITIKKGPKILMEVKSKYFVLRPERITGLNTTVKINLAHDSIYHNDLSFNYFVKLKEVNLLRTDEFSSKAPYFNSYHKVDMDFDQLIWKIDQPKINLTMAKGTTIGKAQFESLNYYNQEQYDNLQGMDAEHPLVSLHKYSRMIKSEHFTVESFADYLGRQLNEIRQELMVMAKKGFIYYNTNTDIVTIKKRLHNYLSSSAGNIDYDVVNFVSTTQAPRDNATLDMETFDLYINGIPKIAVSDSQNVTIYPTKEQIIMKENRSFQFDGKVDAGLFTFYGKNFFFNYNDFKINLQNVDSVSLNVQTGEIDNYGNHLSRRVTNVIQHLTGDVQIDKPDNKSGRKHLHQYPRFESRENSYVYYQSKNIEGGVYPQKSFYFEVYPFGIDSLDHLSKASMNFKGKFQSSGILPPIEQQLKLQKDYSLGFLFNPGPGGIPVYGGKGQLFADIKLNNNGLRGSGKLNYLTSVTTSKEFKFYPDSMNTQSDEFTINEQTSNTQYPKAQAKENYIHWATSSNKMIIKQGNGPFSMFNTETDLKGTLFLDPAGLTGTGNMKVYSGLINARKFKYQAKTFDSDTSQFLIKSLSREGYTVITENNVNAHIDFNRQKGEFTANEDYTKVEFPDNKYISFLNYFKWNMDEKTLDLGAKVTKLNVTGNKEKAQFDEKFSFEEEPLGPRYISLHPKQDSLNFIAPSATYDYQKNFLNASDVKLIRVADAIIYPKDGKVTIGEAAQMRTIYGCTIVANYKERFHTIKSTNVNIQSRNSFTGAGTYDYINENDSVQSFTFSTIRVDSALHTIAQGSILETDSFYLSPFFAFQGKVTLNSSKPLLTYAGGVKPVIACDNPKPVWLKFNSEIEPKDIYIPIDENPVNYNNNKIFSGILLGSDSIHVYPAFLSGRRNYNDSYIHTSSGFLHYNHDSILYEIASKEKMLSHDSAGNYLSIHKTKCMEYGEGSINLGVTLGQVKLDCYGNITYNLDSKEVLLDAVLGVDFMIDQPSIQIMANQIDSFPKLGALNLKRTLLVRSLYETLGKAEADVYQAELATGKPKAIPLEVQHTLNFTDLKLRWNSKTNSYQSEGKIGIGNIYNNNVNRMVDGFVEITRKRSGDYMDIYLKLDDKTTYYFGYTRGVMQVFSTNTDFLASIRKLTLKQRVLEVPKNETSYIFMISSDSKIRNFMRSYNRHIKGELQSPQEEKDEKEEQKDQGEQGNK